MFEAFRSRVRSVTLGRDAGGGWRVGLLGDLVAVSGSGLVIFSESWGFVVRRRGDSSEGMAGVLVSYTSAATLEPKSNRRIRADLAVCLRLSPSRAPSGDGCSMARLDLNALAPSSASSSSSSTTTRAEEHADAGWGIHDKRHVVPGHAC